MAATALPQTLARKGIRNPSSYKPLSYESVSQSVFECHIPHTVSATIQCHTMTYAVHGAGGFSLPPSASTLTRGGWAPPIAFRPTDDYVTVYEDAPQYCSLPRFPFPASRLPGETGLNSISSNLPPRVPCFAYFFSLGVS